MKSSIRLSVAFFLALSFVCAQSAHKPGTFHNDQNTTIVPTRITPVCAVFGPNSKDCAVQDNGAALDVLRNRNLHLSTPVLSAWCANGELSFLDKTTPDAGLYQCIGNAWSQFATPDYSGAELLVHKDTPNGYQGLNASGRMETTDPVLLTEVVPRGYLETYVAAEVASAIASSGTNDYKPTAYVAKFDSGSAITTSCVDVLNVSETGRIYSLAIAFNGLTAGTANLKVTVDGGSPYTLFALGMTGANSSDFLYPFQTQPGIATIPMMLDYSTSVRLQVCASENTTFGGSSAAFFNTMRGVKP